MANIFSDIKTGNKSTFADTPMIQPFAVSHPLWAQNVSVSALDLLLFPSISPEYKIPLTF